LKYLRDHLLGVCMWIIILYDYWKVQRGHVNPEIINKAIAIASAILEKAYKEKSFGDIIMYVLEFAYESSRIKRIEQLIEEFPDELIRMSWRIRVAIESNMGAELYQKISENPDGVMRGEISRLSDR